MYKKRLVLINKKIFSILILILTFILFVVFFSYGDNGGDYSQKIKEENQRLKKREQQIKSVKDEINNLQKKESGYLEALHKIEKEKLSGKTKILVSELRKSDKLHLTGDLEALCNSESRCDFGTRFRYVDN